MKLILENWRKFLNEQHISYSGVVLDEESKQKLLSLEIPEGWEPVAHHMTITMGPLTHKKGKHDFSKAYPVGSEVELTGLAIGRDERAMAVQVQAPAEISNSFPHITVAVNRAEGGKPFHSNKIPQENFEPLSGITLTGTVEEMAEKESSSKSYQEMLDLIKGDDGSEITINIDVPKGKKKGFGATEKRPVPFDYGEFPDYINDADKMGWDLIIAPSESTGKKGLRKVGNLLPVGRVDYKEDSGKKGNDKIVMASGGKISEEDKEELKVFFGKMNDRFKEPSWKTSLNEDMSEKPTFDHYADQVEIDGGIATLYHVSMADFDDLDPEIAFASKSVYSKAEFRSWNRPRIFFFTKLAQEDASMGRIQGDGYIAKVPWKELYPIYKDPLKLSYPDMNDKYMELTGDKETSPGMLNVFERVATLADELYGYKGFIYPQGGDLENIIVAMWAKVPVTKMETGFYG